MENKNSGMIICAFLNKAPGSDPYPCADCPFGYLYGNSERSCLEASSIEEAIEALDDVAKKARAWADKLTAQ